MTKFLSNLLKRALQQPATVTRRVTARRFVPELHSLADRIVPATIANGVLVIDGTNAVDTVAVFFNGEYRVIQNGQSQYFQAADVSSGYIVFNGNDGNDTFNNTTMLRATAYGGNGNDILVGGPNGDWLYGGDGDDQIFGAGGEDWIAGEDGNDVLYGGAGNDRIHGAFIFTDAETGGYDRLFGGDGTDELYGGDGNDIIAGENGDDAAFGGKGNDRIYGAFSYSPVEVSGNDRLDGGEGNDSLWGGNGNDLLAGQDGDDVLNGGQGNDTLLGATYGSGEEVGGNDALYGADGNDELRGGNGNDTLSSGNGKDRLYGDWGNDLIYAGAGNDTAFGGEGHDSVFGHDGSDDLDGEAGNDVVYGGNGNDFVSGGSGDDICFGGDGSDRVWGDDGKDLVGGGYMRFDPVKGVSRGTVSDWNYDYLSGGAGDDSFIRGDKKLPYWWWDHVIDKESGDTVENFGWDVWGFHSPSSQVRWGHLYSEIIA